MLGDEPLVAGAVADVIHSALLLAQTDRQLAARSQDGDDEAMTALLQRYRRFARARSRCYFVVGADPADLEQEALIGLLKAARDYRLDQDVPFRAFAELCITRQVISAIKASSRLKHSPLNQAVSIDGNPDGDAGGPIADRVLVDRREPGPAEAVVAADQLAHLRRVITGRLSTLEVQVLDLFVAGHSYQAIADRVGRRPKAVDNALQRIKRKLEPALAAA